MMEALTASRGERHTTDIAMLHRARLVTASETESGRSWAEARVKQLTGGDPVTARFMRQDNFTFKPEFKLLIMGNHAPRLQNVDDAMCRRLNFVPFTNKPEKKDLRLVEPAILRWSIEGCLAWQKNGLVRPESVNAATSKYFSDQDLWTQWVEEKCDVESDNRWKLAPSGELFRSWAAYAKAAGMEAGNRVEFAAKIERLGCQQHKGTGGTRIWRGVWLRKTVRDDD